MANVTFYGRDHFRPETKRDNGYRFLPFRFIELDARTVVVNEAGEHLVLDQSTFDQFARKRLQPDTPAYLDLKARHFLTDSDSDLPIRLLATKYRTKKSFLAGFTQLHILVLTLRCEHSCHYCQVSRVSSNKSKYDMSEATVDRALDCIFRTPSKDIKIEFQGGEPLLNFPLLQRVIEKTKERNAAAGKHIEFVVATNLALVNDEVLEFLKAHDVYVSTSLDGPAFIHNANRPRPGNNSHELAVAGILRAREMLGHDHVSALMTTTKLSLEHPEQIIDEYERLQFNYIVLRPISPYGFAVRSQLKTGYEVQSFLRFYRRALDHILKINLAGHHFVEGYAQLLLRKMFTPFATGYVDLQSPAGAGIGVAVYNYDGDVYATDESRMLAEMGDYSFRLGNLEANSYEDMFGGELLRTLVAASCVESLPGCSDCAFQMYCGADPVENYTTQGDIFGHRPTSDFCARNMSLIKHLLSLYHGDDERLRHLFWSWIHNEPLSSLLPAASV
jgi:His-Xaa-Ser system radical SAM maturase HxsB